MTSWIKNVKDSSKRIRDEFMQSMGVGSDCDIDSMLENRTQRFQQYSEALEKLSTSMRIYQEASHKFTKASVDLSHAFSHFFEVQLRDCTSSDPNFDQIKSLAQGALRLEEVQQSLQSEIFAPAQQMQTGQVLQPICELRRQTSNIQHQMQLLKQKLMEYVSLSRAASSQRKYPTEYEKASQRAALAEASLLNLAAEMNGELNAIEKRRSIDMRNELLTVIACQLFIHTRAKEHYEQLLPFLPGTAKPLSEISEYAVERPHCNPFKNDTIGVLCYEGKESRSLIDIPIYYHVADLRVSNKDQSLVHPIEAEASFKDIHYSQQSAAAILRDKHAY
uniref:Uncharacterized protein AlNc14C14G1648 n=1 Tax=Albugo laibachii Nc14 TaxID=890382 RepID=F0W3S2_9STRA|nr:sporangia induced conserved hypothetical protein [Albugo laibachii Nc14]|eukprot:CCA15742.1 sporangia induced conserved hypothetical protein [Albugo laibachii Nc14]